MASRTFSLVALITCLSACSPDEEPEARTVFDDLIIEPVDAAQEPAPRPPSPFGAFSEDSDLVTTSLRCPDADITPGDGQNFGPLYGCIMGRAQTAKYWINASAASPETIENVKVMWNRWTRNIGAGAVDADEAEARLMAVTALGMYEIDGADTVLQWFLSREVGERTFEDDRFRVTVRKSRGPAINEHLLVIEPLGAPS